MKFFCKNKGHTLIVVLWTIVILSIILINLVDESSLKNLIVINNFKDKKIYQKTVSNVMTGINKLKYDENDFDSSKELWFQPLEYKEANITYKVVIKDVGSKLNINYTPYNVFSEFKWWNEDLKKRVNKSKRIFDFIMIQGFIDDDNVENIKRKITVMGKFNLNTDRLKALDNLLIDLEIGNFEKNLIISYIEKKRNENYFIKVIDLQDLYLEGLSTTTFNKLKPYITDKGNLNINLVEKDIIDVIFDKEIKEEISSNFKEKLLVYRESKVIKDISQLEEIINNENCGILKKYFTVQSNYFLIKASAIKSQEVIKEIVCTVKRYKGDKNQWEIKILKWKERR